MIVSLASRIPTRSESAVEGTLLVGHPILTVDTQDTAEVVLDLGWQLHEWLHMSSQDVALSRDRWSLATWLG